MHKFEHIDLEPLPALSPRQSGGLTHHTRMFHETDTKPLVNAQTDSELARAYLYHAELAPTTLKSTRTELGRFLLWCQSREFTLGSLQIEDLVAYRDWLRDPQPAEQWISPTRWPRQDPRWRPFSGPLSEPSVRQAFRVVKSLLTFAANAGYLARNAGSLVKNVKTRREARVTRYLGGRAVESVYQAIRCLPGGTPSADRAKARNNFLFVAFLTTGARLSELAASRMGALYIEEDGRWWLDVIGKGRKPRRLPVASELLNSYKSYRLAFGLSATTARDDATPLILNSRGKVLVGVTDEAAAHSMKTLFAMAAGLADQEGDDDSAAALRNASAHWLRHTMLTKHANNGVALKTLQDNAGHASLSTTATYLHKSDIERHDELVTSIAERAAN